MSFTLREVEEGCLFYLIPLGRLSESGAVVLLPALPQLWGYRYIHYHTQLLLRLLGISTQIRILIQQALLPLSHLLCPRWDICWVLFSFMSSCSCFLSALNSLLKKTRNIELQDLNLNFRKASLWLSPSFNPPDNVFLQYMAQDNFSSPIWPREIKTGMHPVSCLTVCAKQSLVHTHNHFASPCYGTYASPLGLPPFFLPFSAVYSFLNQEKFPQG